MWALIGFQLQGATLQPLNTVTNPAPAVYDSFGISLAGVGNDRFVVGTQFDNSGSAVAGTAYLFSTSGTLLTTFTNPSPATANEFGVSVASMGTDRVVIGAYQAPIGAAGAGAAYLFGTDGTLLTAITNPVPSVGSGFGDALVVVGDKIVVGASADSGQASLAGTAYLLTTNGTVVTTFANPTPESFDLFGIALASMGGDRVLIGAMGDGDSAGLGGSVYLFNTNGTLLRTISNPTPSRRDFFGAAVTAVGGDKILIGARGDGAAGVNSGTAYVYSTNGVLLTTITNPHPAEVRGFGVSVAELAGGRLAVGAYLWEGATTSKPGAVYLFDAAGNLLSRVTRPGAVNSDYFGFTLAAVGSATLVAGAPGDSTGSTFAGSVDLLRLAVPSPGFTISCSGGNAVVNWVTEEPGWVLQDSISLGNPGGWSDVAETISIDGSSHTLTTPLPGGTAKRFFRLRQ